MVQVLFFCLFFSQSLSIIGASRSMALNNPQEEAWRDYVQSVKSREEPRELYGQQEEETKEQVAIRQEFIEAQAKYADDHLSSLNLPNDVEEIIRGYLYPPEMFRVAMGTSYTVRKAGTIKTFVASSRNASYAIFQMEDYSFDVYLLGNKGPVFMKKLQGLARPIIAIAVSPNNQYLFAAQAGLDGKLWNLQTGELLPGDHPLSSDIDHIELVMKRDDILLLIASVPPIARYRRGRSVDIIRLLPTDGPPLFARERADNHSAWVFHSMRLHETEQLLVLQELNDARVFQVGESRCGVYDRHTDIFSSCFNEYQAPPGGLVAGRISLSKKNTLFLLSRWGLSTYQFDYTKQEKAKLLHVQRFSYVRFKKPSTALLSDDGKICAIVTDSDLEVWYLPTETLMYRERRTGTQKIPTGKLSLVQDRIAMVDDQANSVRCYVKNPDFEKYIEMLPSQTLEFMKKTVQKPGQEEAIVVLGQQERRLFAELPPVIQNSLKPRYALEPLASLNSQKQAVVDAIMRQTEQLQTVRPTLSLTPEQEEVWIEMPEAVRKQVSERVQVKRYKRWPWLKIGVTTGILSALIVTDLVSSRISGKELWMKNFGTQILWALSSVLTKTKKLFR